MNRQLFQKKQIQPFQNDSHGLKRNLSAMNLVALGIGAIIGTGIFVITGTAAANYAGPALTISFVISAVGCVIAGLCYAEFASMIPTAGSVYAYTYATLGELLAWFAGWVIILEYLFACSTVAAGWSGYMLNLLDGWGVHLAPHISYSTLEYTQNGWGFTGSLFNFPAVFVVSLVTTLLLGGIRQSAVVNNIIVVIKVGVILLFIGFGLSYIDISNWSPYIPKNTGEFGSFGFSGILRGAGVVFFAFLGFDALSTAAQEAKNPQRDMPKGILWSLLICSVLYIAMTAVLTGIVNFTQLDVAAPIALAIDQTGSGLMWLSPLIKLGAISGLSSVILVMMLAQSRTYYAISKDGLLPKFLSKVHSKRSVPQNSIIFSGILTGLFAGVLPLNIMGELVSIGALTAFTIVCISVVVLRRNQPDLKRSFRTPFVPYLPILGAAICMIQMVALPLTTWVGFLIWIVIGMTLYFTYGMKNSKVK